MKSRNNGPYGKTPINSAGFLDLFVPRPIPVAFDDVLYEIIPKILGEISINKYLFVILYIMLYFTANSCFIISP